MAVPKRAELADRQSRKRKTTKAESTEYGLFLSLKYDFDRDRLPSWKKEKYFELKKRYEK